MSRRKSGTFLELQDAKIGQMTPQEAAIQGLADLEAGAVFEGSPLDELGAMVFTVLDEMHYRPAGFHLDGRNIESELHAGRQALMGVRDDDGQSPVLREAVIPGIAAIEGLIIRQEFKKPLRDPMWGADIMDLVSRIAPHKISNTRTDPATGLSVVTEQMVAIDISTLTVETDDYGEVCAWIYSEGEL